MRNEDLYEYTKQNNMLSVSKAVRELGISAQTVYNFIRKEGMERLLKGVYAYPDAWLDEMKLLTERNKLAVYSHESALLLHHLTDREPPMLTVTVPSTYNATHLVKSGVRVFYVKKELLNLGKIEIASLEGNLMPCYDLERTICDVIRSRSQVDKQVLLQAIKAYAASKNKRLDILSEYAKKFKVSKFVNNYLEVLL